MIEPGSPPRSCRAAVVAATDTLQAASERMTRERVQQLVVVDASGRAIGLLTDRDLVVCILRERRRGLERRVEEVMQRLPHAAPGGDRGRPAC